MTDVDATKNVYLFTHGRQDLIEKSTSALVSKGFSKDKIIMALPNKAGNVGDYMAMLWMPPNPDHIKIQKITKVEPADAEGMIGVWKGVSKDDIFEILKNKILFFTPTSYDQKSNYCANYPCQYYEFCKKCVIHLIHIQFCKI